MMRLKRNRKALENQVKMTKNHELSNVRKFNVLPIDIVVSKNINHLNQCIKT
jgi:hypothetical protein